jgi:hypothetical protein
MMMILCIDRYDRYDNGSRALIYNLLSEEERL